MSIWCLRLLYDFQIFTICILKLFMVSSYALGLNILLAKFSIRIPLYKNKILNYNDNEYHYHRIVAVTKEGDTSERPIL